MIARMKPTQCKIVELYRYSHYVEDKQRIDCRDASVAVSLSYQYDGETSPDLLTVKENLDKNAPDNLDVGYVAVRSAPLDRTNPGPLAAIGVHLPANNLPANLVRNDTCTWQLERPLPVLTWMPLRIEAAIVDELPVRMNFDEFFEAHEFSDNLNLKLTVHAGIPLDLLRNALIVHRKLHQILTGEEKVKVIRMEARGKNDPVALATALVALANHGDGGIITFGIGATNAINGVDEALLDELEHTARTASLAVDPPVPIHVHRLQTPDGR